MANLEEIILKSANKINEAAIFNEASSVWNHIFFFDSLSPGGKPPSQEMKDLIELNFENFDQFKKRVSKKNKSFVNY